MQKRYEERKGREAHCKTADDSGVQQLAPKSKVRQTGGIMGPSFGETRDEIREVRMEAVCRGKKQGGTKLVFFLM
jgi:hypothetical protein